MFYCQLAIWLIVCLLTEITISIDPICDLIAAMDVASKSGYSMWTCTNAGATTTNPCTSGWNGMSCSGFNVLVIALNNLGITGLNNNL